MEKSMLRIITVCLFFVLLFSPGCITKSKLTNVKGPTWVTNLTVPLIDRGMRNGSSYSELRLGNVGNGIGEEGLGFSGKSFNSVKEDLGKASFALGQKILNGLVLTVDLNNPPPGSFFEVDFETDVFDYDDFIGVPGIKSITLSESTVQKNYILVLFGECLGSQITIELKDAESDSIIASTFVTDSEQSAIIDLSSKTLPSSMKMAFSGFIATVHSNAYISFGLRDAEVAKAEIEKDKIPDYLNFGGQVLEVGSFELNEEYAEVVLKTVKLSISNSLPANLGIRGDLSVEAINGSGNIIDSFEEDVDILSGEITQVDLTGQLNSVLAEKPNMLRFKLKNLSFTAEDDVLVDFSEPIDLEAEMEIGIESLVSAPQEVELPEEMRSETRNTVKSFRVVMELTNNSPVGLTADILLSPQNNPIDDPDKVTIRLRLDPGSTDEPVVTENTVMLTREQISHITGGSKLYNQISILNDSLDGAISDDHYIEIKAYGKAEVLVNERGE